MKILSKYYLNIYFITQLYIRYYETNFLHPMSRLFGQTEQVFGPKQSIFEEPPQPPRLSIQDMLGGSTAVASIEQPPDTMYLQMKRPLDMNSLEKGPPKPKQPRLEQLTLQQQLLEQVVPQQPNQQALPLQPPKPIPSLTLQKQGSQQQQQSITSVKPEAHIYSQPGMVMCMVMRRMDEIIALCLAV